jgi:hypothetical protein
MENPAAPDGGRTFWAAHGLTFLIEFGVRTSDTVNCCIDSHV